jgi:hypothetical protein
VRKKLVLLVAVAATALLGAASTAGAQDPIPKNPVEACAWLEANEPDLYSLIATKPGACVSTLASVGLEGLLAGELPSNAAVVGQCKSLEQTDFLAFTPEDGRAYPYQFYWFIPGLLMDLAQAGLITPAQLEFGLAYYESIRDQLVAKNRAGCVSILEMLHPAGGVMAPIFALLPPG